MDDNRKDDTMGAIPDHSLRKAGAIIAGRDYPDYEYDPDLTARVVEAAAPGIRAQFMRDCAINFREAALGADMDMPLAERIVGVFIAFAEAEEEKERRVDLAHGGGPE